MATVRLLTPFSSLGRESKYSVNVNPLLKTRTQVHYQFIRKNKSFLIKRPDQNNNFRVQCFMKSNNVGLQEKEKERTGKSLDEIIEEILKTLSIFIQKTAIAGVVLGLLMTYNPHLAFAASGGRMGGRSFSSSSSSSGSSSSSSSGRSSSSSPSYSSGSSSNSSGSSSRSSSSSSPSYSSRSSSSSSSPSYSSSPSSSSSSSPSYWSSTSSSSPSSSYWSSSSQSYSKPKPKSSPSEDEASEAPRSSPSEDEKKSTASEAQRSSPSEDEQKAAPGAQKSTILKTLGVIVIICVAIYWIANASDEERQPTRQSNDRRQTNQSRQSFVDPNKASTVIMLQVALLGATRSLQKDLDKIAEVADTSTTAGLSYILQESTVALLRHLAYCFSSYSSVDVKPDVTGGENLFNQLTIEERAKFDEETLVNVDNIKKQSTPRKNPNGLSSDYIVMTILVATKGEYKLRFVNNNENLKEALQTLGSIPTSKILAVEVMWTPQEENDTLSERDLLKDYPRLSPL